MVRDSSRGSIVDCVHGCGGVCGVVSGVVSGVFVCVLVGFKCLGSLKKIMQKAPLMTFYVTRRVLPNCTNYLEQ